MKFQYMKKRIDPVRRLARLLTGTFLATAMTAANAGGLDAATQAATNFQTWFYAFCGIVAVCVLLYEGVKCWSGRGNWVTDFGLAVAGVAVVGSVIVLGPWAWNLFAA